MSSSVSLSIATNTIIAGTKFFGFLVTGSPTLFAETIHSCADISNQALLKVGEIRGRGKASELHPFGRGQEKFFWALVSAVSIFFVGSGVTLYHGIHALLHPEASEPFTLLTIGLLLFALLLELYTLSVAWRELGGWQGLRNNRDNTTVLAVLLEDGVAVIGILLTLLVGGVSWFFGATPIFDAVISIAVGIMLGVMALFLAAINRRLLIDTSDTKLNRNVEVYLLAAGIRSGVTSIVLDVNRVILFIRVQSDVLHGKSFSHSYEIGETLKTHFLTSEAKQVDAVYWKFPVKLED